MSPRTEDALALAAVVAVGVAVVVCAGILTVPWLVP